MTKCNAINSDYVGESIIRTTSLIIRTRLNAVSPDYVGKRVVRTRSLAYRENSE